MVKTVNVSNERKVWITRISKVGVSLALMAVIFYQIDLSEFVGLVKGADVSYLALAVGLVIGALILGAYRWQRLLIVQGVSVPFPMLISSYFVGLFFNNFLPTGMGGDVVRIYDVAKYSRQPSASAASVIAERALGSFAQGLIALFGLALGYEMAKSFSAAIMALFLGLCLLLLVLLFGERWARRLNLPDPFSLKSKALRVLESISFCLRNKPVALWVVCVSLLFHAIVVLINYLIFRALGANVSLVSCFLLIPIISVITLLPISINGLGVREGAYIYFFGRLGLSTMESVAASLLFFFLLTLVSLIGGVIFALRR